MTRAAVLSFRHVERGPWLTQLMALEDVFAQALDAQTYFLESPSRRWPRPESRVANIAERTGLAKIHLDRPLDPGLDVLFVTANDIYQMANLYAVSDLRRTAATKIAFISEVWPTDVDSATFRRKARAVLDSFDGVFVSLETGAAALRRSLSTTVEHLMCSVDVPAFSDRIGLPRPIAVSNLGRKDQPQHEALKRWAWETGRWYHFDVAPPVVVQSFPDHLLQFSHVAQASACWVVNVARFSDASRRMEYQEIGLRFYEALAAGCALLGEFPMSPMFERGFGGLPGLFPMPLGSSHVPAAVDALLVDEVAVGRVAAVHRARAMRSHDHAHRIATMLRTCGIEAPAAITQRIAGLARQADELEGTIP